MHIVFSLCLPREEASVPLVRRVCRESLKSLGVLEPCIDDLELAITEACTNVLKHAARSEDEYDVSLEIADHVALIKVSDNVAGTFDHAQAEAHRAELIAESGRGIQLMKALVDQLKFESRPDLGTVVQLEKKLVYQKTSLVGHLVAAP